jgi:hypothetical protein
MIFQFPIFISMKMKLQCKPKYITRFITGMKTESWSDDGTFDLLMKTGHTSFRTVHFKPLSLLKYELELLEF